MGVNALRDIILLIINLHMKYSGRGLGRTKLMKLLFLIDHDAIKEKLGKSVTGLKWYKWFYGPFSNGVYPELNKLLSEGYIKLDVHVYDDLRTEYIYYLTDKKKPRITLPEKVIELVDSVVKKYANKSLHEVLTDVYKIMGNKALGEEIL